MQTLVQKILDGNSQAVLTFYKTYSPRILRYLQQKLPPEVSQEILNDVFLDAIDSLATMHKQENVQAWLYQIAHHKIVNFFRKKKIKSFLFSQMPYLEVLAEELSQPEFVMEKDKIRDDIESAMRGLSEKYRTILRMHYEEQMPVKIIAAELNLSFKATESLLYRARQNFIKVYERT